VVGVRSLKKDHARVLERLKEVDTLYHEERAARQAIERTSGNQVYIVNEVKTTVDVSIQTQINNFIPQLEALLPGGFEKYGLPEPPKGEMGTGKVKSWLIKLRDALTTTKNTTETVKRRRRTPLQADGASKAPPHENGIRLPDPKARHVCIV